MDWGRRPYDVLGRVHLGEDAPIVKLRWYVTDLPAIDYASPVNSRDLNRDQWTDYPLGELPEHLAERRYNGQWSRPASATGTRYCHAEFLAQGEPWPNSLPSQGYDVENIPLCCGCPMCCAFVNCNQDDVNGQPASYLDQFAIDPATATDDTPRVRQSVVMNYDPGAGLVIAQPVAFYPKGIAQPAGWVSYPAADAAGNMVAHVRQFAIDANNSTAEVIDAAGWSMTHKVAGADASLTIRRVGGGGVLGGTNLKIDPAIMPDGWHPMIMGAYSATGNNQANATAILTSGSIVTSTLSTRGVRLPDVTQWGSVPFLMTVADPGPSATGCRIYPAVNQKFTGVAVNTPIVSAKGKVYVFWPTFVTVGTGVNPEWTVQVLL